MKKWGFILTTLLIIASSCTLQPKPESIPVPETPTPQSPTTTPTITPTSSPVPTITPTPLPDISPVEWASSSETGVVIPQKMFPLVGAIGKKHRRTIDLDYAGLRIALVLGEGVDLQDPRFAASQRDIRSFYAGELNEQEALKQQLAQVKATLDNKGTTQDYVVIIEGQDWPDDPLVSPPPGYVSQVVLFGRIDKDEIKARYVLGNGGLKQLSKEEEPQLLPELRINGPYTERTDTGEYVQFVGIGMDSHTRPAGETILSHFIKKVEMNENLGIISNVVQMQFEVNEAFNNLDEIEDTARYLESRGMYLLLNPTENGHAFPTQKVIDALNTLATRLAYQNNVIFNLYNEIGILPNGLTPGWSDWTPWIGPLYNAITNPYIEAGRPLPYVLVGGTAWSRDFRDYNIPLENNTWAANVHNYPYRDCETCPWYDASASWKMMVEKVKVPVWITENGAVMGLPGVNEEDVPYVIETLAYAAQYPYQIHYVVWNAGNNSGDSTRNEDGSISPKGLAFKNSAIMKTKTDFTD